MLVACSLVNLTDWERQARAAFRELALRYDGPEDLAAADPSDLHGTLRPLGLWRRRAEGLVRFAQQWVERGPPEDASRVASYHGMGKYASDSWAIFVDGRTDVTATDGKLLWHLRRLHAARDAGPRGEVPRGGDGDARPELPQED